MAKSYQESGVDLEAGYEVVRRIKKLTASTNRPGVMGGIGAFGGLFDPKAAGFNDPILVSGTDGVGTKLKIAFDMNRHDTIGIDAVAMCVNDVVAQGAAPLFFLDYVALGKNHPDVVENIVKGVAEGCRQSVCALIGGETAEMPGMYDVDEYDIAGFCVGAVERNKLIDGSKVADGDVLIGLPSSGVHSNGFSLVRKVVADNALNLKEHYAPLPEGTTLGEALLTPTIIYVKPMLELFSKVDVHGVAHITGGGFYENVPRMIPDSLTAHIDTDTWTVPPVFRLLENYGKIDSREMFNVFNMGIGMIVSVAAADADKAVAALKEAGADARLVGNITKAADDRKVLLSRFD